MAASLHEILLTPEAFPHVITDCQALVDQQLDAKSGLSGTAVKVAYKAVTSFAPGYYQSALESIVPDMTYQLDPYWADFTAAGGGSFGDYLAKRGEEVSEALLQVTDGMARDSNRAAVVKAYNAVRGGASKHIEAALPSLGALVQKYAH